METEEKIGIIIAVIVLFGGAIWNFFGRRREKKQINQQLYNQPVLTANAADGSTARVVGTVRMTGAQLVAPLSQKACVMYWTRVIPQEGDTKDEIRFVPFAIDRGAEGVVNVDAQFARLDLPTIPVPQNGPALEAYVTQIGLNISQASRSQYYEIVLEPGMQVSIAGTVMHDAGDPQGYRGTGTSMKLAGNQQHPLVIGR